MSLPTTINGTNPMMAIIDGIMETNASEATKKTLLQRIEQEGGVISAGLRNDLAELFENAAQQEQQNRESGAQSAQSLRDRGATELTSEELLTEDGIANQAAKEQHEIANALEQTVLQMRGDVLRMERSASGKQEGLLEADNAQTIDQIREQLGLGKNKAA